MKLKLTSVSYAKWRHHFKICRCNFYNDRASLGCVFIYIFSSRGDETNFFCRVVVCNAKVTAGNLPQTRVAVVLVIGI